MDGRPHADAVINTAIYGADMLYHGPALSVWQRNHGSAVQHANTVEADLATLLAAGKLIDVTPIYQAAPTLPCIVSPMAVVVTPAKKRVVVDASFPPGMSQNDFAHPAAWLPMRLPTVATLGYQLWDVKLSTRQALVLNTYDFEKAYRTIPVRWQDMWQSALTWRGRIYYIPVLTFGQRTAGFVTQAIASAIATHTREQHDNTAAECYVDDTILAAPRHVFARVEHTFKHTATAAGFKLNTAE